MPRDHVITKAFYLIENFPGRYADGQTWIEALPREGPDAERPARAGDGVSPIIITSNDLAAAWATGRRGEPLYPLVPGAPRQREMAFRAGVNIVMYALTGNYKADQVHVPPCSSGSASDMDPRLIALDCIPLCRCLIVAGRWLAGRAPPSWRSCAPDAARCCARWPCALFIAALFNPSLRARGARAAEGRRRRRRRPLGLAGARRSAPAQTDAVARRRAAAPRGPARRRGAHHRGAARPPAARDGTRLFSALQSGLADVPPERVAGAIMVTDGVVHDIPEQRRRARLQGPRARAWSPATPASATGASRCSTRRASASSARTRRSACASTTPATTEPVRVVVRRDGEQVLERQRHARRGAAPARAHRPWRRERRRDRGRGGRRASSPPSTTRPSIPIEGIREKLRVLLVSGQPHAGERTWRNILKSDANVDLVHFTILRPPEKQDGTPINELSLIAFPTRELFETKIAEFDLIIFDRYANQSILPSRLLRQHRALRARGRRGAGRGRSGIRRPHRASPARRSARVMPAQPDGRIVERAFLAAGHRHRAAPPRHPRAARLGGRARRNGASGCARSPPTCARARP